MNTVLSLIIMIRQNSLKQDNNYIIADYIIKNVHDMEKKSIKQLSEDCFVSTTSIIKFCKLLGMNTYSEFKSMLISTIKTRKMQLIEKNKYLNSEEILNHIISFSLDADVLQLKKEINQVIEQIKQYKEIHIYGATFPLALATSFAEDMAIKGIYVNIHQYNYEVSYINKQEGVHIVVTYSGRFIEVNRNTYMQIISMDNPSVLISQKLDNKGVVDYSIQLPNTISSQYDDIILLLLFDYILLNV